MKISKVTLGDITHAVMDLDDPRTVCQGSVWWEEDETKDIKNKSLRHVSEITCEDCLLIIKAFKDIKGKIN